METHKLFYLGICWETLCSYNSDVPREFHMPGKTMLRPLVLSEVNLMSHAI